MKKFNISNVFTDLLFNILLGILALFLISLMLINPKAKNEETPPIKGELLITLEWPPESEADVDLFVKLPTGKIVCFRNRNSAGASLDRDDRGMISDVLTMPDGSITVIKDNWENVYITALTPGWYTVNTYVYANIRNEEIPVTVTVQKFKPYSLIFKNSAVQTNSNREVTHLNFLVSSSGNIEKMTVTSSILTQE